MFMYFIVRSRFLIFNFLYNYNEVIFIDVQRTNRIYLQNFKSTKTKTSVHKNFKAFTQTRFGDRRSAEVTGSLLEKYLREHAGNSKQTRESERDRDTRT